MPCPGHDVRRGRKGGLLKSQNLSVQSVRRPGIGSHFASLLVPVVCLRLKLTPPLYFCGPLLLPLDTQSWTREVPRTDNPPHPNTQPILPTLDFTSRL